MKNDIMRGVEKKPHQASESNPDQQGLPIYHAYRVEIPKVFLPLGAVFLEDQSDPPEENKEVTDYLSTLWLRRFHTHIVLHHCETDAAQAIQEFSDASTPELFDKILPYPVPELLPGNSTYGLLRVDRTSEEPIINDRELDEYLVLFPISNADTMNLKYEPLRFFINGQETLMDIYSPTPQD